MFNEPPDPAPLSPRALPLVVSGPLGRCPRCAKGSMFKGLIALAESCAVCGLSLAFADTGDGPAFFASFIGGFIILGLGVWMQVAYEPAIWVYFLVFIPFGFIVCVGLLRIVKGILVSLQYSSNAGQGRLDR